MKNIDKIMSGAMTRVMLNCDKATFLISKNEEGELKCIDRVQLKMHLLSCKYCRRFSEQSKFITKQIGMISANRTENIVHHLSKDQKSKIQKHVDIYLNGS